MSAMQPWQPWQPNLQMNPQWGSPVGNWSQPIRPMFMQPQMGCQPIVPIYQQIVSPPAQVVVQREHRSHLEGFLLAGLLFMLGRGLRELSRQSTDQSGEPPAPVSRLSTLPFFCIRENMSGTFQENLYIWIAVSAGIIRGILS